ncbi:hypothetical protein VTO42DRAFT_8923 [Malbranchea cinnamomea]
MAVEAHLRTGLAMQLRQARLPGRRRWKGETVNPLWIDDVDRGKEKRVEIASRQQIDGSRIAGCQAVLA